MTALIAVAHGSRDPRSSATVLRAVDVLRLRRPDLDVRVAFLDLSEPGVPEVLDDVAGAGHLRIVAVPMLLGSAFHAKVDLPALLAAASGRHPDVTIVQADVLGDDRLLVEAVRDRILETGVAASDSRVGIALAAVGSSDPEANERTRLIAATLLDGTAWSGVVTCFATSVEPSPREALARLHAHGATRVVVAPWFLAPGRLTDRVSRSLAEISDVVYADVIGAHPAVAELASLRYDEVVAHAESRSINALPHGFSQARY